MAISDILDKLPFSPVDKETAEVAPLGTESKLLGIIARGGDPVRSTHPGRVQSIIKTDKIFTVILAATLNGTDNSGRTPDDPNVNLAEFPNTFYSGLGSVNVQVGEKVSAGHQLGTVSFFPNTGSPGGTTGITYGVNANGSSTEAARLAPQGEIAISLIKRVNTDPTGPPTDGTVTKLKEEPKDADPETVGLNEAAAVEAQEAPASLDNVGTANFPYVTRPQVRFVEQKNQVFSHDVLVYISGVDVTPYLVGQLDINIVDKDGWNECSLSLNNAMNNFIITQENMGYNNDLKGVFRADGSQGERKYSEQAKKSLIEYKKDNLRNPTVDIEKMRLVRATTTQGVAVADATGNQAQQVSNATGNVPPVRGQADGPKRDRASDTTFQANPGLTDRRWQLGFMSAVFHKHDPIRVFRKNPIREADEWMPAFTGYLAEISYDTDYITGKSQVKLSCYDIRALAAKMRVQETAVTGVTNPRALFQGEDEAGSASLFTDLLNPTVHGHPLQAKRYEDVMEFLITGTSTEEANLNKAFARSKFRRGIGDFTVGEKISYRPGDSRAEPKASPDPLEHWHALCLFGTNGSEGFRRISPDGSAAGIQDGVVKAILPLDAVNTGRVESGQEPLGNFDRRYLTVAEVRSIGEQTTHDGEWAPHKQYVHFLLPADGTGARNLLDSDVANANSNQLDFRSRLDIMQDFSARIDYQFWVSPMGDFIVEFPQYDFMPEDYGEYSTVLKVDKHLTSDTIQDEAGDMVTAVIAHGRIRPEGEAQIPDFIQPKAVVVSPMMMMRYGVLEHELTLPFVSTTDSLARLAQIEFQKKLAESNKMNLAFNYRPWLLPNRPVEHMERKRIGLTTAVNNSMQVFKEANTAITTRYVRRQLFRSDGTANYTFIFSGTSMPITYREIFENSTITPSTGGAGGVTIREQATGAAPSGSNTANPTSTSATVTQGNVQNATMTRATATPAASPTPSSEQVGRFMALAQQNSGWNELNRQPEGGYGIFGLSDEQRRGLGIGDNADPDAQIEAADGYFRNLVSKWKGDLDMAVMEFQEGIEAVKNVNLVEEFKEGFGAINKKLGAEYEKIAQSLKDEFNELFPGDSEPTDQAAQASDEAKAAIEEAETAAALPSGQGYQSTVGVLVFTKVDAAATPSTDAGATQVQATQNVVTNDG